MAEYFLKNANVKYRYGAIACASLNFTLRQGDKIAVVGDCASGKSTLLKLLAGLVNINGGVFLINDKDAGQVSIKDRNAVLIQDRIWLFNLRSVEYNLTYSLRIRGESGAQLKEKAKFAAKSVGLTAELKTPVFRLSKEDKIRLCYARLFMREADLYLIDDLYKELAEEEKERLLENIIDWAAKDNKTVVLATENLQDAMRFSNRILLMSYGVQTAEGNIGDIAENVSSVWVFKTIFPHNELVNGYITYIDNKIVLIAGDKKYDLNAEYLIDEIFIGKNVLANVCDNKIIIFDVVSENLIYPIK